MEARKARTATDISADLADIERVQVVIKKPKLNPTNTVPDSS